MEGTSMHKGSSLPGWTPETWRITRVREENSEVATLEVEPAGDVRARLAEPGQFYMLYAFGVGEVPISISSIGKGTLQFTIRRVGAVSEALCRLKPGEGLGLRGPFGQPWPLHDPKPKELLLIAGGVGLAPLKPVIEAAIRERGRWTAVHVLYGTRDPEHILYAAESRMWRQAGLDVLITVDCAQADWNGPVGVVTQLFDQIDWKPQQTLALLCGPEIMMRFSVDNLLEAGLHPQSIYLSMERNMKCALGFCGHCQYGSHFICKDGPVFRYDRVARNLRVKEL
jgi:NAD(P)H-flavin reductase